MNMTSKCYDCLNIVQETDIKRISNRCIEEGCKKYPAYNFEGQKKAGFGR